MKIAEVGAMVKIIVDEELEPMLTLAPISRALSRQPSKDRNPSISLDDLSVFFSVASVSP